MSMQQLRFGFTYWPGWIGTCALKERSKLRDLLSKCRNPGLDLKVLGLLEQSLGSSYEFLLVPTTPNNTIGSYLTLADGLNNESIDIADIYVQTAQRSEHVTFSAPVLLNRQQVRAVKL